MNVTELQALKKQYDDAVAQNAKPLAKELLTKFFEANPDVALVVWTQYTPHFNDGDACVFRVNDPFAATKDMLKDLQGQELEDFLYDWDANLVSTYGENKQVAAALKKLEKEMQTMDDLLEEAFGDHMKVTAYADGKFETDDYSHD